jgi:hypothetical protein
MARKKPARPTIKASKKAVKKAKKKAAPKAVARKTAKKAKKVAKKAVKKAKKPAPTSAKATAGKKAVVRKVTKPVRKAKPVAKKAAAPAKKVVAKALPPTRKPNLDRPRKTVADIHGIPSSLGMASLASSAHSGGEELRDSLKKNNSASPRLTGGDVDANWQNAEAQGDESPGGDNPTPDQDVVDEIGRALGVEYADDEELQGGAEITERDAHRWELDPSSKEDFEDEE